MPFKKGESGNPKGRPKGSRNARLIALEALLSGEEKNIMKKALAIALDDENDSQIQALKLCLERLMPPVKDNPISLKLPKMEVTSDLPKITSAIFNAVTKGEITPLESVSLLKVVDAHRNALETTTLKDELDELKETVEAQNHG